MIVTLPCFCRNFVALVCLSRGLPTSANRIEGAFLHSCFISCFFPSIKVPFLLVHVLFPSVFAVQSFLGCLFLPLFLLSFSPCYFSLSIPWFVSFFQLMLVVCPPFVRCGIPWFLSFVLVPFLSLLPRTSLAFLLSCVLAFPAFLSAVPPSFLSFYPSIHPSPAGTMIKTTTVMSRTTRKLNKKGYPAHLQLTSSTRNQNSLLAFGDGFGTSAARTSHRKPTRGVQGRCPGSLVQARDLSARASDKIGDLLSIISARADSPSKPHRIGDSLPALAPRR